MLEIGKLFDIAIGDQLSIQLAAFEHEMTQVGTDQPHAWIRADQAMRICRKPTQSAANGGTLARLGRCEGLAGQRLVAVAPTVDNSPKRLLTFDIEDVSRRAQWGDVPTDSLGDALPVDPNENKLRSRALRIEAEREEVAARGAKFEPFVAARQIE